MWSVDPEAAAVGARGMYYNVSLHKAYVVAQPHRGTQAGVVSFFDFDGECGMKFGLIPCVLVFLGKGIQ